MGGTQQFTATVSNTTNAQVSWSVNDIPGGNSTVGTISPTGLYAAPGRLPAPTTVTVVAASQADPSKKNSSSVVIQSNITGITLIPQNPSVILGDSMNVSATVSFSSPGQPDTSVTWTLTGIGSLIPIDSSTTGFAAPATGTTPATSTLKATSVADPSKFATVQVLIPQVDVQVFPSSSQVPVQQAQQFQAQVMNAKKTSVQWLVNDILGGNATFGTIDASGFYLAPAAIPSSPSVTVKAISDADTTRFGSSTAVIQQIVADTTPPTILATIPASAAVDVPIDVVLQINFSEAIDLATVTSASVKLSTGATDVPLSSGYDPSSNSLLLMPVSALQNGVTYTVSILASIKDLAGNALTNPVTWTFSTIQPQVVTGSVTPPQGVSASNLTITSLGQSSSPSATGSFQTPVKTFGVTTIGAVFPANSFAYLGLAIAQSPPPGGQPESILSDSHQRVLGSSSPMQVDAQTTAESLIFLSPHLATNDPSQAQNMLGVIKVDPLVREFAAIIDSKSSGISPVDDPEFLAAYIAALKSVLNTLSSQSSAPAVQPSRQPVVHQIFLPLTSANTSFNPPNGLTQHYVDIDLIRFEFHSDGNTYFITPRVQPWVGVDWLIDFAQIDPLQLPADLNQISKLDVFSPRVTQGCLLPGVTPGAECHLPSWAQADFPFSRIDVISDLTSAIANSLGTSSSSELSIPSNVDGAYVARLYSGGIFGDLPEWTDPIPRIPHGLGNASQALVLNIFYAAWDGLSAASGLTASGTCDPQQIRMLVGDSWLAINSSIVRHANPSTGVLDAAGVSDVVADALNSLVGATVACTTSSSTGGLLSFLGQLGMTALRSVNILSRINSAGQAGYRVGSLLAASPVETAIFIVGSLPATRVCTVAITPPNPTVTLGAQVSISAVVKDCSGAIINGLPVNWISSNLGVATVDSFGKVTPRSLGTATITAQVGSQRGYATLTVTSAPLDHIDVQPSFVGIPVGRSVTYIAEGRDASNNPVAISAPAWKSSDTNVIKVDAATGVASALVPGTATITATADGKSGTAQVQVVAGSVDHIHVSPSTATVQVGKTQQFVATSHDAAHNVVPNISFSWISTDPKIASVVGLQGVATGVSQGSVQIQASAAGKAGSASLQVVAPGTAPQISGISPSSPQVQVNVSQTITVQGSNFQPGLTVTAFFPGGGSSTLSGSQIQNVTAGSFQASMVLNSAGIWGIRVNNPDGQQSNTFNFTVTAAPPLISSVVPSSYPPSNSNQTMTINGSNFVSGATLSFGSPSSGTIPSTASKLTFVSSSQLSYQFNNGSDAGTWTVVVINPNGQTSNSVSFVVVPPTAPQITSISPTTAPASIFTMTLNGTGFQSGAGLKVHVTGPATDSTAPPVTFISSTQITAQLDMRGGPGSFQIQVINPDGQASGYLPFTITPSITSVSPNPVIGSNSAQPFTIIGNGFTANSTVTLRDKTAGQVFPNRAISSRSSTQLVINPVFTTAAATWSVEVLDGSLSSGEFTFQVVAPAGPQLTSISPTTAGASIFTMTLNGTGFQSGAGLKVHVTGPATDSTAPPVTFISSTQI
ncbi:MAG: Ig-like domain-containing protein, partial [Acidobacteria bacterium]|nr:Ig-like domain-containing protein [Acidobacteriota bacterium]